MTDSSTPAASTAPAAPSGLRPCGAARWPARRSSVPSAAPADALLSQVLKRAEDYNADPQHLARISCIAVFGSYLDGQVTALGDLDLHVTITMLEHNPDRLLAYSRSSGRRFNSFIDALGWPQTEGLHVLRNRSGYLRLHTEDISRFTTRSRVVYQHPLATEPLPQGG